MAYQALDFTGCDYKCKYQVRDDVLTVLKDIYKNPRVCIYPKSIHLEGCLFTHYHTREYAEETEAMQGIWKDSGADIHRMATLVGAAYIAESDYEQLRKRKYYAMLALLLLLMTNFEVITLVRYTEFHTSAVAI